MASNVIKELKGEQRAAFLQLDPIERMLKMERALHEIISIKAAEEGVSESDIYNRYLKRNKKRRHSL